MPKEIVRMYNELLREVREYESDTFSASGEMLTSAEAVEITDRLICSAIEDLVEMETLDGVRMSELLELIREN